YTTATYPFGEGTLVYKVRDKMFALITEDNDPQRLNLKCDPEDAKALRAEHDAIIPGYHMNKKHWNSLILNGNLSNDITFELIDHSFKLVVNNLKKVERDRVLKKIG
ncbi:MAG: MmcQ/YjbR family DNA-binding protein, partial [Chloroflexota bacterium]